MLKKLTIICCVLILAASTLVGCSGRQNAYSSSANPQTVNDNYRTFYEIYVGSFADSNGDGIGDLKGLTAKLDYINDGDPTTDADLGVTGIWLMPIFASPTYHKYDTTNYYEIDRNYGTMADLENLARECNRRGIKLILDFVINHTANTHPWFTEGASQFKAGSGKYKDYYNFSSTHLPSYHNTSDNVYYEGSFGYHMPDLNLENEAVKQEILDIAEFYLKKGIGGFRLDAVKHFMNSDPSSIAFLQWLRLELESIDKDVFLVGEMWGGQEQTADYYRSGLSYFNFELSSAGGIGGAIDTAARTAKPELFTEKMVSYNKKITESCEKAIDCLFISNHDNARSGGYLKGDDAKRAASLYLLAPGSPFIYYGEEIGMKGSGKDENKRLHMQWGDKGVETKDLFDFDYSSPSSITVKSSESDLESLLNHYRRVIRLREANIVVARGESEIVDTNIDGFSIMKLSYNGKTAYVAHNFSDKKVECKLNGDSVQYVSIIKNNKAYTKNDILTIDAQVSCVVQ